MNRRHLFSVLGAAILLSAAAFAVLTPTTQAANNGATQYRTLPKRIVPDADADKIEVLSFFHYGCPHCAHFEPDLDTWGKTLGDDVQLRYLPATWGNPARQALAQLFYTIAELGLTDTLHAKAFEAVQKQRLPLHTEDGVRQWLEQFPEVDAEKFMAIYHSFGMKAKLSRSLHLEKQYNINSVPAMAVDGQYIITAETAGVSDNKEILPVIDALLDKVRAARKTGGAK